MFRLPVAGLYDQDSTNGVLFFWSFYILMFYFLLNMFLAIIVDAYVAVSFLTPLSPN